MSIGNFTLTELGWQPFFARQVSGRSLEGCLPARVCAHHGGQVLMLTENGEISVPTSIIEIQEVGRDRTKLVSDIAVGDWYLIDSQQHRSIEKLERKTFLCRKAAGETVKPQPIAANVDTAFIVSSCNQEFNLSRIERYLALVLESGCDPVVVLTKADLCDDPHSLAQQVRRLHRDVVVETLDARDASQAAILEHWCQTGRTVVLLGSSGVGKSTLAVAMSGQEILTQSVRPEDDKGRHTTTARSFHRLTAGGWLIDNPGMRELQLPACEQGVADLFEDLLAFAKQCRYRNCSHRGDSGCAVEAAVEDGLLERRRLNNYLKLQSEQRRNSATLAERRERDKSNGRMYKRIIGDKRNMRNLR